jgi:myo-inositol-1(or 4)-monophosphatase
VGILLLYSPYLLELANYKSISLGDIMHAFLNTATTAARKAGKIITRAIQDLNSIRISEKGKNDFVTETDQHAEEAILEIIRTAYPSHAILAEESGEHEGDEYQWIIDPLDGTRNFIHGIPHCAISIALKHRGRLEHGLIYDPFLDELFTASRGQGARLNNHRIRVGNLAVLEQSLVNTTLPRNNSKAFDEQMNLLKNIGHNVNAVRMTGCAALGLAYTAVGRYDMYWEMGLKSWDIAAGALVVREAGGIVADLDGSENFLETGNIVAGNLKLVKQFLPLLKA